MSIALVYLVRRQNGPEPLRRFLAAYEALDAGIDHRLVLAVKGYESRAVAQGELELTARHNAEAVFLPDDGFDLMAYFRTAAQIDDDVCCFLNSFSQPLVSGWLETLTSTVTGSGVGLAGATGSWGSQRDYLRYQLGLSSGYSDVYPNREEVRQAFLELGRMSNPSVRDRGRFAAKLGTGFDLMRQRSGFPPYPAVHLRTNALAVRRELFLSFGPTQIASKFDAYRFESGSDGLTARVLRSGLRALVIGRDGIRSDPEGWPETETFWQGSQQNLLVADNRTGDYDHASSRVRLALSQLAWGTHARPT